MSHEINKTDRFGEVRSKGQRAWHGLGIEIPDGCTAQEGFEKIGLGWRTILAPVYADIDVMGEAGSSKKQVELLGHRAHMRADTLEMLGMVTDGYKPFENQDLARFADELAGADAAVTMETGGSLYNGKRVFALLRLPKTIRVTDEDILKQYILVGNGHGGFASFSVYPTSVRVVCANTLRWSETDLAKGLSFRHTGDTEDKLKQARLTLGLAMEETERFEKQVKALVRTNLSVQKARAYMLKVWEQAFGKVDELTDSGQRLIERRNSMVNHWLELMDNEKQSLKGIKGTAWAAYNAVSEWHDHERGRFRKVQESDARVHSNVFGLAQKSKLSAFRQALALTS